MPVASVSTMAHRMRRTILAGAATALALALTTGCTPEPAPSPSPTGFASEEEAFAAAEATYRAYVDAVNARNSGDTSAEAPTGFLSGAALQAELDSEREFANLGIRLDGPMELSEFELTDVSPSTLSGTVCLDVSQARVVDKDGNDVTPVDRPDRLGLVVKFQWTPADPLITQSLASDTSCS